MAAKKDKLPKNTPPKEVLKATLFKTDGNIKILIVSETDYSNILSNSSKLFNSHIESMGVFETKRIDDLLELLKPDVLLSETGNNLNLEAIKSSELSDGIIGVQLVNNNGNLILWYEDIDDIKLKSYLTLSLLINHPYEIKNKLGID